MKRTHQDIIITPAALRLVRGSYLLPIIRNMLRRAFAFWVHKHRTVPTTPPALRRWLLSDGYYPGNTPPHV